MANRSEEISAANKTFEHFTSNIPKGNTKKVSPKNVPTIESKKTAELQKNVPKSSLRMASKNVPIPKTPPTVRNQLPLPYLGRLNCTHVECHERWVRQQQIAFQQYQQRLHQMQVYLQAQAKAQFQAQFQSQGQVPANAQAQVPANTQAQVPAQSPNPINTLICYRNTTNVTNTIVCNNGNNIFTLTPAYNLIAKKDGGSIVKPMGFVYTESIKNDQNLNNQLVERLEIIEAKMDAFLGKIESSNIKRKKSQKAHESKKPRMQPEPEVIE